MQIVAFLTVTGVLLFAAGCGETLEVGGLPEVDASTAVSSDAGVAVDASNADGGSDGGSLQAEPWHLALPEGSLGTTLLRGVWGTGSEDVWVVGALGIILVRP